MALFNSSLKQQLHLKLGTLSPPKKYNNKKITYSLNMIIH